MDRLIKMGFWCVLLVALVGCAPTWPPRYHPGSDPLHTLLAAGDIAVCGKPGAQVTAKLLDRLPGTILTLGDLAYWKGSANEFRRCYDPTWGRHKHRTWPAPGNHEYLSDRGAPYFAYWGSRAGEPGRGFYSVDIGPWHIVALNSNIGAGPGSEQERWLRADLEATKARCILAYWHHPLFSSGGGGHTPRTATYRIPKMATLYRTLYTFGASVVLAGHDHNYERFAPQDPRGRLDPEYGIRTFVVGTGGAWLTGGGKSRRANSEVFHSGSWGVLKLSLFEDGYTWQFVPVDGQTFRDTGGAACVPRRQSE